MTESSVSPESSDTSGTAHLSEHHRTTLRRIESHPTTNNLDWHDVLGLLAEVAEVREEDNGKYVAILAGERLVLTPPKHADVDEQTVVDLRELLTRAGYIARRS